MLFIFFVYMTEVKSLWSLYVGLHTCYKGKNKRSLKSNLKPILKNYLSSDCSLKFENMKSKSLVIVNSTLRWINSQILHTPPITLEKLLGLENIKKFNFIFIFCWYAYWWFEWSWHKVLVGETCWWSIFLFFFKLLELLFCGKYDVYFYSTLYDMFVVLLLYSFIKLILLSSLVELIWPTQFFNRRCLQNVLLFRLRTYTEYVVKLRCFGTNVSQKIILVNFFIFFKIFLL